MANTRISLSPTEMRARIADVSRAEQDFYAVFTKMQGMMTSLEQDWHGTASQQFSAQFSALKDKAFNPMMDLLYGLRMQLENTLKEIENLDQQIAGKFKMN